MESIEIRKDWSQPEIRKGLGQIDMGISERVTQWNQLDMLEYEIAGVIIESVLEKIDNLIFIQERIGKDGDAFDCYKFRTKEKGTLPSEKDNTGEKTMNDPRDISGRQWMRKTGFDELLNAFNILKGDMALVGPRPLMSSEFYGLELEEQEKRKKVKPGIFGTYAFKTEDRTIREATSEFMATLEYYKTQSIFQEYNFKLMCITESLKVAWGGANT